MESETLTERLVAIHHFWREEGCGCHGLLNAFHLVWLVANQSGSDRIITGLNGAGACHSNVQHRPVRCLEASLLSLVQSVRNCVHLRRVTPTVGVLRPL